MPRIQKPFYNLHQIDTGKYTPGAEFVLKDGTIYIGSYHILPSGQRFTGFRPERDSVELFELRLNPTEDILKYNQLTGNGINRYNPPISFQPIPSMDDYKRGKIERFFIQKRNSPQNTIMEIDHLQYQSINMKNNPGINGVAYNKLRIDWIISKIPLNDAAYLNDFTIKKNLPSFPNLNNYITNNLEFYR